MTLRAERFDRGTTPAPLLAERGVTPPMSFALDQINNLVLYPLSYSGLAGDLGSPSVLRTE